MLFYCYLNFVSTNKKWLGTKMIRYKDFLKYYDAYVIRHSSNDIVINDGGWHFSYMGGLKRIREKISTGSHQEFNNDRFNTKERITKAIIEKRDFFDHGDRFDFVDIDVLPKYIQDNKDKYASMIQNPGKKIFFKNQYLQFLEFKHTLRIIFRKLRKIII